MADPGLAQRDFKVLFAGLCKRKNPTTSTLTFNNTEWSVGGWERLDISLEPESMSRGWASNYMSI